MWRNRQILDVWRSYVCRCCIGVAGLAYPVTVGRFEFPVRNMSTSLAHFLPLAIACTTRDCPRCMSPHENTLCVLLSIWEFVFTFPNLSYWILSWSSSPLCCGCMNPIARSTRSAGMLKLLFGTSIIFGGAFFWNIQSTLTHSSILTFPFSSPMNLFVMML